ncbi:probable G-protein coupled receptor 179 isoform X1 [Takifugu flavidus]|uniref:probable G-protein coupled receptor 179 isoform X1 n=1 Tax=Takifugu flavidus TaxID=433684 RepID=UPI0025443F79|nr:probable G-protein coupled receptor 179 isoform X1 [Takifugu flavidus]XP_056891785.1 probable G-protein coupled receptor 179 isoform X1 [Takifugu flavidus]
MHPVLLLLLPLPSLLRSQVTPPGATVEENNGTESPANSLRTSNLTSPSSSIRPPEDYGYSLMPSGSPTEEEDDWSPAETYMYTGQSSALEAARCSRAYSPAAQTGSLPQSFNVPLGPALDALTNTANFLNMIFQASDLRESTVEEDMEWYHALVRALLEADRLIRQALLTFDADPTATVPQLVLRASHDPAAKVQTIILQDFSKAWDSMHQPAPAPDDSWFRNLKFPESNQLKSALFKRVLLNDLSTLDTPKWRQGDSYVTNRSGVHWASAPFLDCQDGRFVPGWMLTLSMPFYGLKPDLTPEFRGVIRVDVNIQDIDLDQCRKGDGWFADTHQCNRTTMECVTIPGRGFRLGQFCCRCKEGYYNPEIKAPDSRVGADGGSVNRSDRGVCYPNMPICLPCWPGCKSCEDATPCWVQEAWLLRGSMLALQGVFMFLVFVSMLAAYKHRRSRRIRASGLLLLEMILFGSLLLYFPVFIMYFKPSTFRCILLRWVRMLGFSIVYGIVTLKMYRVLKVFLSRTAQRVPYMSSLHLLRILGVMLMTVSWFLCAWTVGVLQNRDRNIPVFITATTSDGQGFNVCYVDRWDYMMAVAELLFLCWGSSLWTAVRPVPSAFHEPRYMGIAIHNELLLSTTFHLIRFTFPSLHPDWMLLLSFTHTHVTITVTLALLFIPKFLYVSKPGREEIAAEVYEDEVDLRRSYLNSSFHSAWSEHSVDPDDFRDELKKLYAQLEVHKTKKMAANNPHLTKKRSSRCALGRSIIKRIAEIPETVSRQCSREERDGSFRSKAGNQSGSFRSATDTVSVSISYRSSMKTPSPSLRKSNSDHYHVREQDSSLYGFTLNTNAAKRSSRRSETDSLDIPPGVCKSVSAQNLTIDTNLLHPDHTKLHKSWSLTSNSSIENRASNARTRSRQRLSIGEQTRSALQSESFDKAEICPWEVEPEQSDNKSQKHVTYVNTEADAETPPWSPPALVCPWDHLPPPVQNNSSEDQRLQSESESPKIKTAVSSSAPGSPRPKVTKDQRVFSLRTTTNKWLSVKSFMGSMESENKLSKDLSIQKEDSAPTTPRSGASSRCPSIEKKTLQKRSLTTTDGKPCLVKQNAIRLSSGDSSDRSPRRLVVVKPAVHPWDGEDTQRDGTYENVFLSRQNSKRSSTSSRETTSSCRTPSVHRRGSRITPVRNVPAADVCPWEVAATVPEGPKKQQSIKANICPWETQISDAANVCPWESQEQANIIRQGSAHSKTHVWESKNIPVIYHTNTSTDSQTNKHPLKRATEVCPWESADTAQPSTRQDHEYTNVCPWEVQDKAEVVYENLNPLETKTALMVPLQEEGPKHAIYPGAPKESWRNEQHHLKSSYMHLTKTSESSPWDFPEPPKIMENICPSEDNKESQIITVKVDVCPWEARDQDGPEVAQNRNPSLKNHSAQAEVHSRTDICPWETEIPKVQTKQDSAQTDVCPWETEESKDPKALKKQDSPRTDVCPWETEEPKDPKVLKKQDSSWTDVCPWETETPKVLTKQDSSRSDVCPWETETPKVLTKQDSSRIDVCPWETEEPKDPKVLKKQDSSRTDVCPWETETPKVLTKQDSSRSDVCPWETETPKVLTKQDSSRTDVCPWETEEPKVLIKQDSSQTEVCPWEAEKRDNTEADVCSAEAPKITMEGSPSPGGSPSPPKLAERSNSISSLDQIGESKENLVLSRRDALYPWEMVRSRSGSFTDNCSDVFTWEPENIPEEDEEEDAECAAEALVFPPDL